MDVYQSVIQAMMEKHELSVPVLEEVVLEGGSGSSEDINALFGVN
jgi:hypothetical protein